MGEPRVGVIHALLPDRGRGELQDPRGGAPSCRVHVSTSPPDNPTTITDADINPHFKKPIAYQAPHSIRFGMRLSF